MHLFYLYKKSSKKHRELRNFYHLLEGQFEMYSAGVRSLKATGTRWIDHKIASIGRVIEKFGLYIQHLQHSIDTAKKSQDSATLHGKFTKLINAKFLLRCALFTDVLAKAKHFSLITQEQNIDIIHNNECLLKKLRKNPAYVFQLPTVKLVTEEIESNDEDGEPLYQNQKAQFYSTEKRFIENHIVQIIERVVSCFEKCYGNLYSDLEETSINIPSDDSDRIIFDVCRILNCNVWPNVTDDSDTATHYSLQLAALITVFNQYKDIDVMKCYTEDDVLSSFLAVLRYAHQYFNTSNINPIDFWSKILSLADEHIFWKPTTLIIEICLCVPFSNASLERLFSQMNLIKTTLRNRLTNDSLNSILRINISGLSLKSFHDEHLEKHESKKTKRPHLNISGISSESESSSNSSASEDEIINYIPLHVNFIPLHLLM